MTLKAPQFWRTQGTLSWLLSPLGWCYGKIVAWRLARAKNKVSVPVLCVGNLIMGGAGKTPTAIALAEEFQLRGYFPHFLSRGYGGQPHKALQVDLVLHSANDVGDEALLLAQTAPTWIGADRYASAQAAISAGATILIMDDGLQNPTLFQDVKIAVFDAQIPLVNTHIFPAGPLRENFDQGLRRVDYLFLINFGKVPDWALNKPSILARTTSDLVPTADRYLAFAGIGYPEKFYNLLSKRGFNIILHKSFPDHYAYNSSDIKLLLHQAECHHAQLITTEKDLVKIPKDARKNIQSLRIRLETDLTEIVNKVLKFF